MPATDTVPRVGFIHLVLALGGFAIGTTEFATMSLLPGFAHDLGIDAPTAGHVISAYAMGVVVGAPAIAVLAARMARWRLLVALMVVFGIGNLLSALAGSYGLMMTARFLTGLPHGAYFGVAMLVAASLVPNAQRTAAVARVLIGLTVATIVGVPAANWLGQVAGWRWAFVVVAALALTTAAAVAAFVPRDAPDRDASPLRELGALARAQVWLTLGIGAIGFGGLFAVYTYLASTMAAVTQVGPKLVIPALMAFGVGATLGNIVVPKLAGERTMAGAVGVLVWSVAALAAWPLAAQHFWSVLVGMAAIGVGGALAPLLQTRLMDVAGDAQTLAAALNHAAFNVANALGPWLGGIAIAAGYGWTSTGWVGVALALGGLAVLAVSVAVERRRTGEPAVA